MTFLRQLARALLSKRTLQLLFILIVGIAGALAYITWQTHDDPIPKKLAREQANTQQGIVTDVTELYPIHVQGIVTPHRIEDIVNAVKNTDHVSIGGGRNSMGGQTASERAVQIDMREYNKILDFSTTTKEITVQSGIRWYDIQKYIDPYNLSIKVMQTYSNFTVGGSLSVNVHGRYVGLGPIVLSVKSFRIVLADGSIVNASPTEHSDIFYSAIGGLGGMGVISDVTLSLADNVNVERTRVKMPTAQYGAYFAKNVRENPDVIFHNGDLYPPAFDSVSAVSWIRTDKQPTTADRLIPKKDDYWKDRIAWVVMSEWPGGRWIREYIIDPFLIYRGSAPVHTRNYEASYDIAELEPEARGTSTYVLQEYFVPVERFDEWIPKMKKVFNDNNVNVINVSIRHAKADPGTVLAWAPRESFAFVVYYKQGTDDAAKREVTIWTREMIDQVLSVGGKYYLPYQPLATEDQFHRAYPGAITYFEIKKKYDPTDKFTNNLWDLYYSPEKMDHYTERQKELSVASTTSDYYRSLDSTYLSTPEWNIVYAADQYAAVLRDSLPSRFPYFSATNEYWRQYASVLHMTATSTNDHADSVTVLWVIGYSFSAENIGKGIYELTFGRLSEWIAGDVQVPEDHYAAQVAQQYADFIYDHPWYDFPYAQSFKGVWHVEGGWGSVRQDWRRIERRFFLSFEYGMKTVYASLIRHLTQAKFGVSDEIVHAIVTRDGGKTYEMISAPHYQPFTRLLLDMLEKESGNAGFAVVDIAGNQTITLTYRDATDADPVPGTTLVLRDTEIVGVKNGDPQYVDRLTVQVNVADLEMVYQELAAQSITIDHFYDY